MNDDERFASMELNMSSSSFVCYVQGKKRKYIAANESTLICIYS